MIPAYLTWDWPHIFLDPLLDQQMDEIVNHCTSAYACTGKKYSNSWAYN